MLLRRRMMARRLVRVGVGTAVVAGTAGVVRHAENQHWANQQAQQQAQSVADQQQAQMEQMQQQMAMQQQQIQQMQAQQTQQAPTSQAAPAPAAAPPANDLTAQLNQLAQMHTSGILTDQEFAEAKQKLLAGG